MQKLAVGPLNIFSSLIKWRVGPGKNNTLSIQSILMLFCRNRVRAVAAATWVCKNIMKTSDFISNTWLRGEILWPRLNPMSRWECVTRTQRRALTQLLNPRLKEGFWIATYSWCESASTVKREGWNLGECFSLRVERGGVVPFADAHRDVTERRRGPASAAVRCRSCVPSVRVSNDEWRWVTAASTLTLTSLHWIRMPCTAFPEEPL